MNIKKINFTVSLFFIFSIVFSSIAFSQSESNVFCTLSIPECDKEGNVILPANIDPSAVKNSVCHLRDALFCKDQYIASLKKQVGDCSVALAEPIVACDTNSLTTELKSCEQNLTKAKRKIKQMKRR